MQLLHDHPSIVGVIVLQSQQGQHRGPHIGMIGPRLVVDASLLDARTDKPEPGLGNLRLNAAMHPGERWVDGYGRAVAVCTHAFGSFQETTVGVRSGSPL